MTKAMVDWLAGGERGISSNAIFTHITGIDAMLGWRDSTGHPHDPADWRRCEILLEQCPELRAEFYQMKEVSDIWKRLVENWDKIRQIFIKEAPYNWRDKDCDWCAPETYDLMCEIIHGKTES